MLIILTPKATLCFNDVKIIDPKGTIFAKNLFDIKAKTLKITSNKNDKVKANINLK